MQDELNVMQGGSGVGKALFQTCTRSLVTLPGMEDGKLLFRKPPTEMTCSRNRFCPSVPTELEVNFGRKKLSELEA